MSRPGKFNSAKLLITTPETYAARHGKPIVFGTGEPARLQHRSALQLANAHLAFLKKTFRTSDSRGLNPVALPKQRARPECSRTALYCTWTTARRFLNCFNAPFLCWGSKDATSLPPRWPTRSGCSLEARTNPTWWWQKVHCGTELPRNCWPGLDSGLTDKRRPWWFIRRPKTGRLLKPPFAPALSGTS